MTWSNELFKKLNYITHEKWNNAIKWQRIVSKVLFGLLLCSSEYKIFPRFNFWWAHWDVSGKQLQLDTLPAATSAYTMRAWLLCRAESFRIWHANNMWSNVNLLFSTYRFAHPLRFLLWSLFRKYLRKFVQHSLAMMAIMPIFAWILPPWFIIYCIHLLP